MIEISIAVIVGIVLLLFLCNYNNDCYKKKEIKTAILRATREELGAAERQEKSCEEALKQIDADIVVLRDQLTRVSVESLQKCLASLDPKIDEYDRLQRRLFAGLPESEQRKSILSKDQIKRKYGVI